MMELLQAFSPEAFAGHTALGTLLVIPTVEVLRAHVLPKLDGALVAVLAVAVGAAYGLIGSLVGYLDGALFSGALFGAWAGAWAAGLNKYVDAKLPDKQDETERGLKP